MGQLKLMGMKAIQDVKSTEDVDIIEMLLVTDPLKITHYINFWRQEAMTTGTSPEHKDRANKMVNMWLNYAERQGILTCSVYSFETTKEVKLDIKEPEIKKETVDQTIDQTKPADVKLTVVKDNEETVTADENRILRVKYESLIKKVNVESLKQMCVDLIKSGKTDDAIEVATFLLSNGLYTGKKVKQWSKEKIVLFIESCKTEKTTETNKSETVAETTKVNGVRTEDEVINVNSDDTDLHKKYANYLDENAITLAGLKVETKLLLKHGELDKAMELATFLLAEGLTADTEEKWSNTKIEDWFKEIRQELIDHPDDLTSPVVEDAYDLMMVDLYTEIKNRILSTDVTEEKIKEYILNVVESQKVENLDMYYKNNNTKEELESMYATFFVSFVSESYKQRAIKALDVTEEIVKYIQKGITNGEKAFGSAVQSSLILFKQKGEKVSMKEARDIVYKVGEEKFPEQYKVAMEILNKAKSEEKTPIIQADTKIAFPQKYPEIWENIKDTNPTSLDDVYNMARELEKTQSFLIVSEMIIHFISSGKINDKDGKPVTWELAAIEMWINTMFKEAETVAETKEKVEPTIVEANGKMMPADLVDPNTPNAHVEPITQTTSGTTETALEEKANVAGDSVKTEVGASTETAPIVKETTASAIEIPKSYKIPDDKVAFRDLYALKNDDFWIGFTNNILRLEKEGKSQTDIIHEMADVIKVIAMNDDLTQCHARNFKKTRIDEMYKIIKARAIKYEIPGWVTNVK